MKVKDIPQHIEALAGAVMTELGGDEAPHLAPTASPEMGDLGFPCFTYARALKKAPQQIAQEAAARLSARIEGEPLIASVKAIGPYVTFTIDAAAAFALLIDEVRAEGAGFGGGGDAGERPVMIEYSSPNTNKPQHLGHIRNNLLGESVANMVAHQGREVIRVNLINDRGIHICKSMLAYMRHGEGATPEGMGLKGDHLIGHFYVLFNTHLKAEYAGWLGSPQAQEAQARWAGSKSAQEAISGWRKKNRQKGQPEPEPDEEALGELFRGDYQDRWFNTESELGAATKELLVKWEEGDAETIALWRKLNGWVEAGFAKTYERMGVHFDQIDHESETYLQGKALVERGLAEGVFERSANGAIVFNLERIGQSGEKAVLRKDGTSLYVTQDMGTATMRFEQHNPERLVYVVGDEQNHYFNVMFAILGAVTPQAAGRCYHLSYGMVNLPDGRMKSREGTVVDADALMDEMHALSLAEIRKRYTDLDEAEMVRRAEVVGLAALKFFLLNHSPQTTMVFNPEESLRFEGRTGPFCLYAYARTASILRKAADEGGLPEDAPVAFDASVLGELDSALELALIKELTAFPATAERSAAALDPSKIAEQAWKIAKCLATFFSDKDHHVLGAQTPEKRAARLQLIFATNRILKVALGLLGIEALEQM